MRLVHIFSATVLLALGGGCLNGDVRALGGGQLASGDAGDADATPTSANPTPAASDGSLPTATAADAGSLGDAGRSADAGSLADAGLAPDAAAPPVCAAAAPANGSGHHNPGTACAGCHNGGNATRWTIGGTLYADANGAAPLAGATILVTDAAGQKLSLVTASNGNFYTATAVTYPLTVSASKCPSTTPMIGAVAAPASCNSGGCHAAAGMRIHLP